MSDKAVRQHYALATGGGQDKAPAKTSAPGYAKGGSTGKGAGNSYGKGGKPRK